MKFAELYKTDPDFELHGVWKKVPRSNNGRVKIARMNNSRFLELRNRFAAELRAGEERTLTLDEGLDVLVRAAARAILLGWENFNGDNLDGLGLKLDKKSQNIIYSKDNAEILLREFKDFREDVFELASNINNFIAKEQEIVRKNSKAS